MDLDGLAALILAVIAALTAIGKGIQWAAQRVALERQAKDAMEAKNRELEELKKRYADLWALLEGLTK